MPPPDRWFEDFAPGQVFEFGDYLMTLAEILGVPWRMADGFWPHPDLHRFLAGLVPHCRVVELVMDAYQHWTFRRLAALGNLDYDCVPGRALPGQATDWVHDLRWTVSPMHVQAAVAAALAR